MALLQFSTYDSLDLAYIFALLLIVASIYPVSGTMRQDAGDNREDLHGPQSKHQSFHMGIYVTINASKCIFVIVGSGFVWS